MRNDFAVFILTHGRADNVVTVPAIKKAGYTGKIYFIIDDEDEQAEEYKKNFGADRVIIFDKQAAYDRADTMDNFNDHRAIIYARNECWRIAKGDEQFLLQDRYADRVQGNHERRCCDIYNIEQPGTPVLFKYTILRGTVANPKPVGRNDRCV